MIITRDWEIIVKNDNGKYLGKVYGYNIEKKVIDRLKDIAESTRGFINFIGYPDLHGGEMPVGFSLQTKEHVRFELIGADIGCRIIGAKLKNQLSDEKIKEIAETVSKKYTGTTQIPSIGRGNHFFEIARDTKENIWLTLHSGSRGVGGTMYKTIKRELDFFKVNSININSALFPKLWDLYLTAMEFSYSNCEDMLYTIKNMFDLHFDDFVETVHNTININEKIITHYKGASNMRHKEKALIPISMKEGTYVVKVTDKISTINYGLNHGAGRLLSRREAKEILSEENLKGINVISQNDVIDEAPEAYKNITPSIEKLVSEGFITILDKLTPIITVKD